MSGKRFPEEIRKQAAYEYRFTPLSCAEVAKKFSASETSILNWADEFYPKMIGEGKKKPTELRIEKPKKKKKLTKIKRPLSFYRAGSGSGYWR